MAKEDFTIILNEKDYQLFAKKIKGLESIDRKSVIQSSLKEGIDTIKREGRKNIILNKHKKTGNLLRSLSSKVIKSKTSAYAGFRRSTPEKKIQGGNHAHLVDRGTVVRYKRNGQCTGSISKNNPQTGSMFWTKAVTTKGKEAQENLMNAVYDAMEKIMNRN